MFSPGMSVHLDDIYIGGDSGLNPHATPFRPNCAVSTAISSSNVLYSPNNHSSDSTSFMESEASDNPLGTGIPREILKNIKLANPNRLIIGHLNINSLPNKIENLKALIVGNIDILVITESKLDQSFPSGQFNIDGYSPPFRYDRNSFGGGVIIFVREDIPCRELFVHKTSFNIEGIFLEINLRKSKWILFGGYNPSKTTITYFLKQLGTSLDIYLSKYDNVLLLGDFNSESKEPAMIDFEKNYNLKNLIKEPTCFKNPSNPSSIEVILSNRSKSFFSSKAIETGLSDHHKLTITSLKQYFPKQKPVIIQFRDYSNFDLCVFKSELSRRFTIIGNKDLKYQTFENTFTDMLNQIAPMKKKYIRANNAPFMNKILSKAVMTRSRIRNRYLKNPSVTNRNEYKRHRNFCVRLFRKEKRRFYDNIDTNKIIDNRNF